MQGMRVSESKSESERVHIFGVDSIQRQKKKEFYSTLDTQETALIV